MAPIPKKLRGGHITLGLSVRPSRFLTHAIAYEPCILGFWNYIYGFLVDKNQNEILSARYISKSISARGLKHGHLIGDDE